MDLIKDRKMLEKGLNEMRQGEKGEIVEVEIEGNVQDRMMAMGLKEKARIDCVGKSPFGNPSAYRVCGAVIAFRNEDIRNIKVNIIEE